METTTTLPDPEWTAWPDEKLLDLRLCDLQLSIDNSPLVARLDQLSAELAAHRLLFRPHVRRTEFRGLRFHSIWFILASPNSNFNKCLK
jgi:hypothetical protein